MKTENRIKQINDIYKAYFTDKDRVPKEVYLERWKICDKCEYNSNNYPIDKMSYLQKARKKLLKDEPFCIACGCQLKQKLSLKTTQCGLVVFGEEPLWKEYKN